MSDPDRQMTFLEQIRFIPDLRYTFSYFGEWTMMRLQSAKTRRNEAEKKGTRVVEMRSLNASCRFIKVGQRLKTLTDREGKIRA
jgi:hypothetical protein